MCFTHLYTKKNHFYFPLSTSISDSIKKQKQKQPNLNFLWKTNDSILTFQQEKYSSNKDCHF